MMRMLRDLKVVLFGWQHMQRTCFVEKGAVMKNDEEFKGYQFRLDYDEGTKSFGYKPIGRTVPAKIEEPILFRPKQKPTLTPHKAKLTA
jgi:hypothetical protein